jgi:hypothetical protein
MRFAYFLSFILFVVYSSYVRKERGNVNNECVIMHIKIMKSMRMENLAKNVKDGGSVYEGCEGKDYADD